MKIFGSLSELVSLIFRKNSQTITLRPNNATTYTAARVVDLPAQDAASTLVSRDSTDTLTNKSISGSANTLTNIPAGTALTGQLPAANGGTGVNSTATFPSSGVVVTEAATETLTNKTISGSSNTITNVSLTAGVTGTLPLGNGGTGQTTANAALNALLPSQGGNNTKFLQTDGSNTSWASSSSSVATPTSSGTVTSFTPVVASAIKAVSSANYTVLDTDGYNVINVTTGASDRTITLPLAANAAGRYLTIRKADSGAGAVIIDANGSELIDGALTHSLHNQYASETLFCDGTGWATTAIHGNYLSTSGSASVSANTWTSIVSITLSPGEWDCNAILEWGPGSISGFQGFRISLLTSSAADGSAGLTRVYGANNASGSANQSQNLHSIRIVVTTGTAIFLNGRVDASSGSTSPTGGLWARRVR